jgi:transposase
MRNKICHDGFQNDLKRSGESEKKETNVQKRIRGMSTPVRGREAAVSRDVLEVCEGRKKEEVVKLLERLNDPDAVKAVNMDMSASFHPAVAAALPKAQIVVDHFHVIQHVMKAFRKVLSSWAHRKEGMILLHRKQYLFLRAKEDLTQE